MNALKELEEMKKEKEKKQKTAFFVPLISAKVEIWNEHELIDQILSQSGRIRDQQHNVDLIIGIAFYFFLFLLVPMMNEGRRLNATKHFRECTMTLISTHSTVIQTLHRHFYFVICIVTSFFYFEFDCNRNRVRYLIVCSKSKRANIDNFQMKENKEKIEKEKYQDKGQENTTYLRHKWSSWRSKGVYLSVQSDQIRVHNSFSHI